VTIASFTCDARRRWDYLLRLLLVQLLTRRAVKQGGHPYGFGIWNSPFVTRRFPRRERRELLRRKREYDPQLVLNPMKLFRVRLRLSIPGLLFLGPVYQTALLVADLLSPLLGLVARAARPRGPHDWTVPPAEAEGGYSLLSDTILRCTFCGACISTCPAYLLTGDELVTGRAKLRLADALIGNEDVETREAHSPFQCLRCGLCEEVCQTRLPLRACYDVVERWVGERHGRPAELVQRFAATVDAQRQRVADVFGITLPAWSPPEGPFRSLPDGQEGEARR
jgi:ferredoxin